MTSVNVDTIVSHRRSLSQFLTLVICRISAQRCCWTGVQSTIGYCWYVWSGGPPYSLLMLILFCFSDNIDLVRLHSDLFSCACVRNIRPFVSTIRVAQLCSQSLDALTAPSHTRTV